MLVLLNKISYFFDVNEMEYKSTTNDIHVTETFTKRIAVRMQKVTCFWHQRHLLDIDEILRINKMLIFHLIQDEHGKCSLVTQRFSKVSSSFFFCQFYLLIYNIPLH